MGWEKVLNLLPYGDEFRRQRKWVQDAFQTKKSLQNYQALQRRAVIELLNRLVDRPDSFSEHFTRCGGRFFIFCSMLKMPITDTWRRLSWKLRMDTV